EVKAKEDAERAAMEAEIAASAATEEDEKTEDATSQEADTTEVEKEPELSPEEQENLRFSWADERFGAEIARRNKASGVLIFYANDKYYDINKLKYFVEQGKERIAHESKIDISRIQAIFGGYRDYPQGEFWIVPANGEFPTATPDERPIEQPQ